MVEGTNDSVSKRASPSDPDGVPYYRGPPLGFPRILRGNLDPTGRAYENGHWPLNSTRCRSAGDCAKSRCSIRHELSVSSVLRPANFGRRNGDVDETRGSRNPAAWIPGELSNLGRGEDGCPVRSQRILPGSRRRHRSSRCIPKVGSYRKASPAFAEMGGVLAAGWLKGRLCA